MGTDDGLADVGQELRRLRLTAGLSGVALARLAGVPQSTVSRVENGRRVAGPELVTGLFAALGLGEAERSRLGALIQAAYDASAPRRVDAGASFRLAGPAELGRSAVLVRCFESAVMPALLRTPGYRTAAALPDDGLGSAISVEDEGRSFTFVLAEAALRTWPGSGECMPGQLAHLLAAAGRPNVRIGVIPSAFCAVPPRPVLPLHGFTLYDDDAACVTTLTRVLTLTAGDDVRAYRDAFAALERPAVYGDAAAGLIGAALADFRKFAEL